MHKAYDDYKKLMISIVAIGSIFIVIGLFIHGNPWVWVKGVAFGTIFTLLRLMLMKNTFDKAVMMEEGKAKRYTTMHYSLRYILSAVVLTVAALEPSISFWGACVGLFTMKLGIYALLIVGKAGK